MVSRDSHQHSVSSVYINHHVCSQNHFDQQQNLALCSFHSPRTTSAPFSPVLDKTTLVPTCSTVGQSNPTEPRLYFTSPLVLQSGSTTRSSALHSRTQPFLLHGCFSDGLGSQLARTTDYGTVVAARATTTHKLSGTGSRPLGNLSLGPTLVSTNRPCILRQQHSGLY